MNILWVFILYIAFHGLNILIAWWNKQTVQYRLDHGIAKDIEHPIYGTGYFLVCASQYFVVNWQFVVAILWLHLSIFPVFYNEFRDEPTFFLSKDSRAVTDKLMVQAGLKNTKAVNIIAHILSIAFFIYSLFYYDR